MQISTKEMMTTIPSETIMTMRVSMARVRTMVGNTEYFTISNGVRQGDALSATLFNIALECAK